MLKFFYNHFAVKCNITVIKSINEHTLARFLLIAKDVNML